ncbi:MAG: ATP-binding protein [Mariprofundaceae bacterium]
MDQCQYQMEEPGDFIYIEVTDTGCGMDKQVREKLFEPFFTIKFFRIGIYAFS